MPVVMGIGALIGGLQGTLHLFGARIDSFKKEDDEFARKETVRRTTRVPIEQTISEVGEGRGALEPQPPSLCLFPLRRWKCMLTNDGFTGIRAPGYEERRRELIKEKYGFEVNPVNATVEGSQ